MEKTRGGSQSDGDDIFSPKLQPLRPCNMRRRPRSQGSIGSPTSLWIPSGSLSSLRLSSSGSDDSIFLECLTPLSPHSRRVVLIDEYEIETEPIQKCEQTRQESENGEMMAEVVMEWGEDVNDDKVLVKHTREKQKRCKVRKEQITREDCCSNVQRQGLPEGQESQNVVEMPVTIPPTSHLALRRKIKREAFSPLPSEIRKGSVDSAQDNTHPVMVSKPSAPINSFVMPSPTSHLSMRQKQITQANSNTLPSGRREESMNSTRDTTRPMLRSRPNIALRPIGIPPRSHQTQHTKHKRQASNPLPLGINKESVESTRDIKHPVLQTKSLPTSETCEIDQTTRPPKTPRSATEYEKQFEFPEESRLSRKPTNKTRPRRNSRTGNRSQEERRKPESHSVPSQLRKSPNSIQPNTNPTPHRPQQRPLSRDRMGSPLRVAPAVWTVKPQSPRRFPRFQRVRSPQKTARQNGKRSMAVDRVLVVKAKDGAPLPLPAIPVERLINKGYYLVPDVGRMGSSPSRPPSKSVSEPPVSGAQMKRKARQTKSMDANNSVSLRQEETSTVTRAGNRKDPHEKNSLVRNQ